MKLNKYTTIRTGLVLSRKEAPLDEGDHIYRAISLKNLTEDGQILLAEVTNYCASSMLKGEYFTHNGDVLLRLSVPYTAVIISEKEAGLLVPAHFAIIRPGKMLDSRYLHWWLMKNRKQFYMIASGATMMGTISSGYIAEMPFDPPVFEKQQKIGDLLSLASREQQLLSLLEVKKKQLIDAVIKSMEEMTL